MSVRFLRAALVTAAVLLACAPARAQNNPQQFTPTPQLGLSFTQIAQAQLSVTTTTSRVAMPAGAPANYAYICNTGTQTAWVSYGGSTVVATASQGQNLAPNQCQPPVVPSGGLVLPGFVAAITSSGSTNIVILVGVVTQPQLGNFDVNNVIAPLAAQAAGTINSQDQINFNGVGANCLLHVSASSGGPGYNFAIQGKDTTSGVYYDVVRSTPNATSGDVNLSTFPGQPISFAAGLARESFPLPRTWRLQIVIASGTVTGTAGCSVLF